MDRPCLNDQREGPRFLGELTALLSHDVKNVLAIINENAGLLEDLASMASESDPTDLHAIDPQRLAAVAGKIRQQVRRADLMIKRLNQVGHSVDQSWATMDLVEMVETLCALAGRKAAMKAVTLSLKPSTDTALVKSDPFLLQQLIWYCLDHTINMMPKATLTIDVQTSPSGTDIVFGPLAEVTQFEKIMDDERPNLWLKALTAQWASDREHRLLKIRLPLKETVNEKMGCTD